MRRLIPIFLLVFCSCGVQELTQEPIQVFKAGNNGYTCFRIPALINTGKTIVAFAEGRKLGCSDTGDIDLVCKRSTDGGRTWSELIVIWDAGENVAGNPAPVFDTDSKKIILLSTWNRGDDHESQIIAGTSKDTRRVFILSSEDEGQTWSGAREITDDVKLPNWTWYATGPVHGIQLESTSYKNRLIIPCDHIEADTKHYYSHIIYSDDAGTTWFLGGTTPEHQVNECAVVELTDGRLMLNMRNYDRSQRTRKVSYSNDGGQSWSKLEADPDLPEPICQASLIDFKASKKYPDALIFCNPSSSTSRSNMMLKISYDQGNLWSDSLQLHEGPAAYSDIATMDKGILACLFEAGLNNPYESIVFIQTSIYQSFPLKH